MPVAGKRIKAFRRSGKFHIEDLEGLFTPQELELGQQTEHDDEELENAVEDNQENEEDQVWHIPEDVQV